MTAVVESARAAATPTPETADRPLTALADAIQATHHAYLRRELPRLQQGMQAVLAAHGTHDPRLPDLGAVLTAFIDELTAHMFKEENILFPMIRQLETPGGSRQFHCGSLANPIRVMEMEHDCAGDALQRMHSLTDGYQPPAWACPTYRTLLAGLAALAEDMQRHVAKENEELFPRAVRLEVEARG